MADKKKITIGGQAVIEGVVMRSSTSIATAVRRKDQTIEVKTEPFVSVTQKHPLFKLPILRGFVSLIEVLIIGVKTLNFSASRAELDIEEEEKDSSKPKTAPKQKSKLREQIETTAAFVFAFVLAFGIFTYLPYQVAYLLKLQEGSFVFNLFTGVVRIVFFVAYVKGISFFKDIKRVFEYHGAEHKAVHAFEKANNQASASSQEELAAVCQKRLAPASVDCETTIHPRCGTSFIFLVLLISILFFSIVDYFVALRFGVPHLLVRIAYHLLMLPLISGVSYEVLKVSERHLNNPLVKMMTMPGMLLQRITTQPPSNEQLEVAVVALCSALDMPYPEEDCVKICRLD